MLHLDQAAKLARDHNQPDLASGALRLMQVVGVRPDSSTVVRTEMTLPADVAASFEEQVANIAACATLSEALEMVAWSHAPGGEPPDEQTLRALTSGMLSLPTVAMNSAGLPVRITGVPNGIVDTGLTEQDLADLGMDLDKLTTAKFQVATMLFCGTLIRAQLDEAGRRFAPTVAETVQALAVPGVDPLHTQRLARALVRYWSDDPDDLDDAAQLGALLPEPLLRHLMLRHDSAIFVVQKGQDNGHLRLMTGLLDVLADQAWFDDEWRRSLQLLLMREGAG